MASAEELKVQLVSEEKYLKDRVEHVERHFAALAADVGGAVRKMALLRDKGDKLVKAIQDFASSEKGTLKTGLEGLAECLTAIENCQQLKIDRMEAKVVKPLLEYDGICRRAKEELHTSHNIREKEIDKQRTLERVRIRDPTNRRRMSEFDTELQKLKIQRLRASKAAEEYIEAFEKKRTQDLKSVLGEYIYANMAFHAKALELFTVGFQHIQSMNEDEVVELFHKGFDPRKQSNHEQGHDEASGTLTRRSPSPTGSSTLTSAKD